MRREDQLAVTSTKGAWDRVRALQGSGFDCVAEGGEGLGCTSRIGPSRGAASSGGNLLQGCGLGGGTEWSASRRWVGYDEARMRSAGIEMRVR